MIEISRGVIDFHRFVFMDEHTACMSMRDGIYEGAFVDEQLFAQMMGWA